MTERNPTLADEHQRITFPIPNHKRFGIALIPSLDLLAQDF
jgi:hypothetical protein